MKSWKVIALIVAALLVIAFVGGRLYARYEAFVYGRGVAQAFFLLGREEFANTAGLRDFFSKPELADRARRVRQLSFLGGQYDKRVSELQTGLLYLSEQAALPPQKRFAEPPVLKYLSINAGDHSDKAIADAAAGLIPTYFSQIRFCP